jgi:hypothetical protein
MLEPLVLAGAKFVLSSTWRERFDGPEMTTMLATVGFGGVVIDRTKLDPGLVGPGGIYSLARTRGAQVFEWAAEHPDLWPFVIFDDNDGPEYWDPVYDRLILVDFEDGLQPKHVEQALRMLTAR